jgi:hypothetical protein
MRHEIDTSDIPPLTDKFFLTAKSDLERLDPEPHDNKTITALVASLNRRSVSDDLINEALNKVVHPTTV